MVNDVVRAYSNAPSLMPTFMEICEEDSEPGAEGKCGELGVSMYGTRPAAQNRQRCCTELFERNVFADTRASACEFRHVERYIHVIAHGDGCVSAADPDDPLRLQSMLGSEFETTTTVVGHDKADVKQVNALNCVISAHRFGDT